MRLFERMAVLVKADAHGVLDHLEEQSLLMKQHLREAELELNEKRARVAALEEEERRLADEATKLETEVSALDADVELALAGGKEDLARFAVRRLIPKREAARALRRRGAELSEERGRLGERLAVQERCFEELRAKVKARLAQWRAEEVTGRDFGDAAVAEEEVELELMRRRGVGPASGGNES